MQACKRLERSKPARRQATVQGSGVCTLHHTGVAQTSGSSEHPGPCLDRPRALAPIRPHVNTQAARHGGSSHVSPQGRIRPWAPRAWPITRDITTALPIVSGAHASHTINKSRRGETREDRLHSFCNLRPSPFHSNRRCALLCGVYGPQCPTRLSVRLRRNRIKALRSRSPEWLVTTLLSRISPALCARV